MRNKTYSFDNFRLELKLRQLWKGRIAIDLTPKEFDALVVLVENSGVTVPKEKLIERLWGLQIQMDDSALSQHIGRLRRKLSEASGGKEYIKAVPRLGYLFVADVRVGPARSRLQLVIWAAVAAVLLVGSFVLARKFMPGQSRPVVAVLRFHGRGQAGGENAWLASAIPEMLRTELSVRDNLRVLSADEVDRAQTELKLPENAALSANSLDQIHRDIGADYVVGGSYTVLPGTKEVRIDVVVQDSYKKTTVASTAEHGPLASLFEIVGRSGMTLRAGLGMGGISRSEAEKVRNALPSGVESAQLFAEGLAALRASEPVRARDLLEQAVASDSQSAVVRSALGEAWARLGYEAKARQFSCGASKMVPPLSRESQLLLEARCQELSRRWPRAIEIYSSLWTFFPDEPDHGLHLVHAEVAAGRPADALRTLSQLHQNRNAADDPRIDLAEAEAAESRGAFADELRAAESAMRSGGWHGARLLVARAQLRTCWALDNLGQRARALQLANNARKTFAELGDRGGEATATKNIADVMDDGGDHAHAIPIYEEAIRLFKRLGSETGIAVSLNNIGYALKDTGDLRGATARFSESVGIAQKIEDPRREAQALNSLGGTYWRSGDLKRAEDAYDHAALQFETAGDRNQAATALGNLGLVFKDEGRLLDSQHRLEQAFDMSRETGDQTGMARTSGNQGDLLVKSGQLEEARKKFQQQLSIGEHIHEDKQKAYARLGLGRVLLLQGKLREAKAEFKQSLDMRLRAHEEGLAAETRLAMAEAEIESGESAGWSDAKLASERFRTEDEPDQEALATALLLTAAVENKGGAAEDCENLFQRLNKLLSTLQEHEARATALLATSRYQTAMGQANMAAETLGRAISDAEQSGSVGLQLQARFMQADMEHDASQRAAALESVRQEAESKGFFLLVSKAKRSKTN